MAGRKRIRYTIVFSLKVQGTGPNGVCTIVSCLFVKANTVVSSIPVPPIIPIFNAMREVEVTTRARIKEYRS
jgi:hypothetical protein